MITAGVIVYALLGWIGASMSHAAYVKNCENTTGIYKRRKGAFIVATVLFFWPLVFIFGILLQVWKAAHEAEKEEQNETEASRKWQNN